ncbi:unnamed protein product [Schistosoma curassoni]|uniref:Uncharacterized protein n=1 Tax=Schistosoma curassoni TaxID=6186 RepID=A0A183K0G3_9TREM|nr:unnamed protein product [Schistosoma curassoni]
MLNRPALLNRLDTGTTHTDLTIDVTLPTIEEIRMVIRQTKSEKAARFNNIPAEALKSHIEVTANTLRVLFRKIWEEEKVPPTD